MTTVTVERLNSSYRGTMETIVRSRINCDGELHVGMVVHVGSKRSQYQARVLSIRKPRVRVGKVNRTMVNKKLKTIMQRQPTSKTPHSFRGPSIHPLVAAEQPEEETAHVQQPEEETTPDQQPEEETTPDQQPEEETTPDQQPEEETTPDQQPEEETTPDQQPEEETTPDQQPEKEATPDQQPEKETTPDQQPEKETTPDPEQEKEATPYQEQEKEETPTQEKEETTPEFPSDDEYELRFSGLSDSDGEGPTIPVNEQQLLPPLIHRPEIQVHEHHLAELRQPTSYHAPYHAGQPTNRPSEELQWHQHAPYHTHQPTTQPIEELQRHQPAPYYAGQSTTRPTEELQRPQQVAPYQSQHTIYHQPELPCPSTSRHLFEAQPPAPHLESLILQLSSKLTDVTRELMQLREEVRTLSGVKEKCPPVFTPVLGETSRIFIGSAESRLEMDKAAYMKCLEAASSPKDLVLSLMGLHFSSVELAASNFNGGEVLCGAGIVTKTALRKDSRFVAIVSQAEAQFPMGTSSPALQRQLREAVNNKCRKSSRKSV